MKMDDEEKQTMLQMHRISYQYLKNLKKIQKNNFAILDEMVSGLCTLANMMKIDPATMDIISLQISKLYREVYEEAKKKLSENE